ncbi:hypothetical protein LINPERHAP2_LOCUS3475, partial [Linum perenne]
SFTGVLPAAALHRSSTNQCKKTSIKIRWAGKRNQGTNSQTRSTVPIYISTNPSHVDPQQLCRLFSLCNHSCHRFPKVVDVVTVEAVDLEKLRIALSRSSVLVFVFCNPRNVGTREEEEYGLGELLQIDPSSFDDLSFQWATSRVWSSCYGCWIDYVYPRCSGTILQLIVLFSLLVMFWNGIGFM